jgi:predicted Zn-dependent peptidase
MLDQMRAVTIADIQRAAQTYLRFDRRLEVTVKENAKSATKDDEKAPITAAPETKAPAPGRTDEKRPEAFPAKAPITKPQAPDVSMAYTENRLKNGMRVLVVSNHETPFITVKLGLSHGATMESKIGQASLALKMLTRGTKNRNEKQLSQELSRYAISLGGGAAMDYSQVNMACLTEHLEKGMELLADVAINPVFDAAEFEKLRKQTLTSLQIDEQNPEYLADKEFSQRLYGQHRYAHTVIGESNDIQKLTPEDLKQWWASHARTEDAVLIFAGDIQTDTAVALATKYLGSWKSPERQFAEPAADFPKEDKTQIWLVDNPGSAQTQIRIGCRSITRHDQPDYFISRVVSNYFGGSFHSWVNETLRVEKGLTYGASAYYEAQRLSGQFTISTFTKNESTGVMVQTILDLIKKLRENKPSEEELDLAKDYITGSFLRRRETPQQVADDLWLLETERLDNDYFDKLLKGITATNAEDCIKLTDKTIQPDKLVIVIVGDAGKITADLEKIAPVKVVEKAN